MRTVQVDGARLAYTDHGDPSADPVVLLHGYPANHRCWRHQIPGLAEDRRVLAPDLLGWGASERRRDLRFDYDTEVARLGRVLDALGVDRCDLVGHDYGGFLALGFAQRHPHRVRRLAILNSRAHGTFVPAWYAAFTLAGVPGRLGLADLGARVLPLTRLNRRGMRRVLRPGAIDSATMSDYLDWMSTPEGGAWLLHFFGHYRVPARHDLADGLSRMTCPTAIIWGTREPFIPDSTPAELTSGIPDAELTLLDGAGHFVMEEAPGEVLTALRKLLRREVTA